MQEAYKGKRPKGMACLEGCDSGSWSMEVELMTNNQPTTVFPIPHQRNFFPTPQNNTQDGGK